jgi:hypothetical protein
VKAQRQSWFEQFAEVRVDQLVFIDEFGATTTMQRTHGRAPRGERVVSKVPHGHWKVLSTIAAMTVGGITVSATFDGATDADTFVAFVSEGLAPTLVPGQVVVLDNLSAPDRIDGGEAAAAAAIFAGPESHRAGHLEDQDDPAQAGPPVR